MDPLSVETSRFLAQQLSTILDSLSAEEWSRSMSDSRKPIMESLCKCFRSQGEFLSLPYMINIPCNFDKYKLLLDTKVQELIAAVNDVDQAFLGRRKGGRLGNKPKLHLLFHVTEDIKWFTFAIHFEAEKGEQFNKFI